MFYLNENGELEYAGPSDNSDASLFANGDMDLFTYEEAGASAEIEPAESLGVDDATISPSSNTASSASAVTNIENYNEITVYAVPSAAAGYPNSSSLAYMEDIVAGYPLHYKYLSFRTDESYAQSMVLYVAPVASIEGTTVTLEDCDVVNLEYIRDSSYSNYLNRSDAHEDSVTIDIPTSSIVYTNITPGYGTFQTTIEETAGTNQLTYVLIGAAALFVIQRLLGGARHD